MIIGKARLKYFDPGTYTATVQLSESDRVYLDGIAVARNIPAAEMIAGRELVVIFFDDYNAQEAVVSGVFTR